MSNTVPTNTLPTTQQISPEQISPEQLALYTFKSIDEDQIDLQWLNQYTAGDEVNIVKKNFEALSALINTDEFRNQYHAFLNSNSSSDLNDSWKIDASESIPDILQAYDPSGSTAFNTTSAIPSGSENLYRASYILSHLHQICINLPNYNSITINCVQQNNDIKNLFAKGIRQDNILQLKTNHPRLWNDMLSQSQAERLKQQFENILPPYKQFTEEQRKQFIKNLLFGNLLLDSVQTAQSDLSHKIDGLKREFDQIISPYDLNPHQLTNIKDYFAIPDPIQHYLQAAEKFVPNASTTLVRFAELYKTNNQILHIGGFQNTKRHLEQNHDLREKFDQIVESINCGAQKSHTIAQILEDPSVRNFAHIVLRDAQNISHIINNTHNVISKAHDKTQQDISQQVQQLANTLQLPNKQYIPISQLKPLLAPPWSTNNNPVDLMTHTLNSFDKFNEDTNIYGYLNISIADADILKNMYDTNAHSLYVQTSNQLQATINGLKKQNHGNILKTISNHIEKLKFPLIITQQQMQEMKEILASLSIIDGIALQEQLVASLSDETSASNIRHNIELIIDSLDPTTHIDLQLKLSLEQALATAAPTIPDSTLPYIMDLSTDDAAYNSRNFAEFSSPSYGIFTDIIAHDQSIKPSESNLPEKLQIQLITQLQKTIEDIANITHPNQIAQLSSTQLRQKFHDLLQVSQKLQIDPSLIKQVATLLETLDEVNYNNIDIINQDNSEDLNEDQQQLRQELLQELETLHKKTSSLNNTINKSIEITLGNTKLENIPKIRKKLQSILTTIVVLLLIALTTLSIFIGIMLTTDPNTKMEQIDDIEGVELLSDAINIDTVESSQNDFDIDTLTNNNTEDSNFSFGKSATPDENTNLSDNLNTSVDYANKNVSENNNTFDEEQVLEKPPEILDTNINEKLKSQEDWHYSDKDIALLSPVISNEALFIVGNAAGALLMGTVAAKYYKDHKNANIDELLHNLTNHISNKSTIGKIKQRESLLILKAFIVNYLKEKQLLSNHNGKYYITPNEYLKSETLDEILNNLNNLHIDPQARRILENMENIVRRVITLDLPEDQKQLIIASNIQSILPFIDNREKKTISTQVSDFNNCFKDTLLGTGWIDSHLLEEYTTNNTFETLKASINNYHPSDNYRGLNNYVLQKGSAIQKHEIQSALMTILALAPSTKIQDTTKIIDQNTTIDQVISLIHENNTDTIEQLSNYNQAQEKLRQLNENYRSFQEQARHTEKSGPMQIVEFENISDSQEHPLSDSSLMNQIMGPDILLSTANTNGLLSSLDQMNNHGNQLLLLTSQFNTLLQNYKTDDLSIFADFKTQFITQIKQITTLLDNTLQILENINAPGLVTTKNTLINARNQLQQMCKIDFSKRENLQSVHNQILHLNADLSKTNSRFADNIVVHLTKIFQEGSQSAEAQTLQNHKEELTQALTSLLRNNVLSPHIVTKLIKNGDHGLIKQISGVTCDQALQNDEAIYENAQQMMLTHYILTDSDQYLEASNFSKEEKDMIFHLLHNNEGVMIGNVQELKAKLQQLQSQGDFESTKLQGIYMSIMTILANQKIKSHIIQKHQSIIQLLLSYDNPPFSSLLRSPMMKNLHAKYMMNSEYSQVRLIQILGQIKTKMLLSDLTIEDLNQLQKLIDQFNCILHASKHQDDSLFIQQLHQILPKETMQDFIQHHPQNKELTDKLTTLSFNLLRSSDQQHLPDCRSDSWITNQGILTHIMYKDYGLYNTLMNPENSILKDNLQLLMYQIVHDDSDQLRSDQMIAHILYNQSFNSKILAQLINHLYKYSYPTTNQKRKTIPNIQNILLQLKTSISSDHWHNLKKTIEEDQECAELKAYVNIAYIEQIYAQNPHEKQKFKHQLIDHATTDSNASPLSSSNNRGQFIYEQQQKALLDDKHLDPLNPQIQKQVELIREQNKAVKSHQTIPVNPNKKHKVVIVLDPNHGDQETQNKVRQAILHQVESNVPACKNTNTTIHFRDEVPKQFSRTIKVSNKLNLNTAEKEIFQNIMSQYPTVQIPENCTNICTKTWGGSYLSTQNQRDQDLINKIHKDQQNQNCGMTLVVAGANHKHALETNLLNDPNIEIEFINPMTLQHQSKTKTSPEATQQIARYKSQNDNTVPHNILP